MEVPNSLIAPSTISSTASQVIAPTSTAGSRTSQKKVEANRRNALRSTGPKTERGKRIVSLNAVKHGLLAREAVITRGHGAENQNEFIQLLLALRENYQPIGISEELLVQMIATCYWRLARVLRFETGETRKSLDNVAVTHSLQKVDEANRSITQLQLWEYQRRCAPSTDENASIQERFKTLEQMQSALRTSPMGIRYLMSALSATRGEIQEKGSLSEESFEGLMYTFGYCDRSLIHVCIPLMRDKNDQKKEPPSELATEEAKMVQQAAISLFDKRLKYLKFLLGSAEKNQYVELDAKVRSLALPDSKATDRVLRYEAHLERQLYPAMDQLERLQRRRKGESVPPPLNFNLGGHSVFAKQSQ